MFRQVESHFSIGTWFFGDGKTAFSARIVVFNHQLDHSIHHLEKKGNYFLNIELNPIIYGETYV